MNPWQVKQSRSRIGWLRRWWADQTHNARQMMARLWATLRRMPNAFVRAFNLSWVHGLRQRIWAFRAWLRWTWHSVLDWVSNARDLPFALREVVQRTTGTMRFVRAHPGLRRFALSLPALATGAAFVTGLSLAYQLDRSAFQDQYRWEAEQALQGRQWDAARVRYRRLADELGDPPATVYALAESLEGLGQTEQAEELFGRLAPDGATKYVPAHLRKAKRLLAKTPLSPTDRVAALDQLLRANQKEPDSADVNGLLGEVYASFGEFGLAKKYLLQAEKSRPELCLLLAGVSAELRDQPETTHWAERSVAYYGQRAAANPRDIETRLCWTQALLRLQRIPEAAQVLRAGLVRSNDPRLRPLLADVYAAWYKSLKADPSADEERQRLLMEGLSYAPDAGPLLNLLSEAARGTGADAKLARTAIDQRLRDPKAAVAMHFCLASDAMRRGDSAEALAELEKAYALAKWPEIANNLAWLLANGPKPDLNRALEVAEVAVAAGPHNANSRDTRGQILVKLGRYQDAVKDLEFALIDLSSSRDLHLALAQTYRGLGLPTSALAHEQRAQELKK